MLDLAENSWEHIDLRLFTIYGGLFTISLDLLIYPLEVIKTKIQVETKVRKRDAAINSWREQTDISRV